MYGENAENRRKYMKKLLKLVFILLVGLLVLAGLALVALRFYFPPAKIKAIALEHLSRYLHREVRLGDVGINPIQGLSLMNLEVSERATFAQGQFLKVKRLSVHVALRPLLKKQIVIRSVTLEEPIVTVIRLADGKTFNFSDLVPVSSTGPVVSSGDSRAYFSLVAVAHAAAPVAPPPATPPALDIANAQIKNGTLRFIDRSPAQANAEIAALNLQVKEFSFEKSFAFQTDFNAKSKPFQGRVAMRGDADILKGTLALQSSEVVSKDYSIGSTGKISGLQTELPMVDMNVAIHEFRHPSLKKPLTGSLQAKGTQARVNLSAFKISIEPLVLTGHGVVENLSAAMPTFRAHVESNRFLVQEAMALLPSALPADLKMSGPAEFSADVSGTSASTRMAAKVNGTGLAIQKSNVFRKGAEIPLELSVIGDSLQGGAQLLFETLELRLGAIKAHGSGSYKTVGKRSDVRLTLKTNSFPLAELSKFSPDLEKMTLGGTGALEVLVSGPVDSPAAQGTVTLDSAQVKAPEGELSGLKGKFTFQTPNALAEARALTLKTDGQLSVGKIQHAFYRGQDAQLVWNLTDVTKDLARVSGEARLTQGEGQLLNADKLAAQSKTARLMLQPLTLMQRLQAKGLFKQVGLPSFETIPFASLKGDYKLRNGVMEILPFDLTGADMSLNTQGTIGLAGSQPIQLRGSLASTLIRGTLGQLMQDATGRATLKFTATGTVSDPQVKLDLQDTTKKALETLGQELLKGLGKKKTEGGTPDPAAQAAPETPKPLKDLEKALQGIFK